VTVPLPCLQKKRRVSAKGRIKQLQKQKVYEHIYHEVYSAQDTHAIAAEKNKASNADSQDAEEKENPIGDVSFFVFWSIFVTYIHLLYLHSHSLLHCV
jgi:hypothetical protein